jgi:hypothetical protein
MKHIHTSRPLQVERECELQLLPHAVSGQPKSLCFAQLMGVRSSGQQLPEYDETCRTCYSTYYDLLDSFNLMARQRCFHVRNGVDAQITTDGIVADGTVTSSGVKRLCNSGWPPLRFRPINWRDHSGIRSPWYSFLSLGCYLLPHTRLSEDAGRRS